MKWIVFIAVTCVAAGCADQPRRVNAFHPLTATASTGVITVELLQPAAQYQCPMRITVKATAGHVPTDVGFRLYAYDRAGKLVESMAVMNGCPTPGTTSRTYNMTWIDAKSPARVTADVVAVVVDNDRVDDSWKIVLKPTK